MPHSSYSSAVSTSTDGTIGERSIARPLRNLICRSPVLSAPVRRFGLGRPSVEVGPEGWRATHLARAARIAPDLRRTELDRLTDTELDTTPAWFVYCPHTHPEVSEAVFVNRPSDRPRIDDERYLDWTNVPVRVDDGLAKPRLEFRFGADGRPLASIDTPPWDGPGIRSHHFEFDTAPDFTSLNLWRCPTLDTRVNGHNLCDDRDLAHYVMRTRERNPHSGLSPTVSFPFPVAAMCLPDARSEIGFQHIEMLAAALGSEGTVTDTIDAVFRYVHARFAQANDTTFRPPIEVLRAGLGGCGHVNFLAAL
jgi:hypothetical protein